MLSTSRLVRCLAVGRTAVAVVLLVALAGCGGNSDPTKDTAASAAVSSAPPSATPDASPSPTPSPTPSEWPKTEAGAYYLQAICPINAAWDRLDTLYRKQNAAFARVTTAARVLIRTDRKGTRMLYGPPVPWPGAVADDVRLIAEDNLREVHWANNFVTADGDADRLDVWKSDSSTDRELTQVSRAVEHLRLMLGLPRGGTCPES
jgi:hypothetical protein